MTDPNFWSIVSVALALAVTLIGPLLAFLAYEHHRRQAIRISERLQFLPTQEEHATLLAQNEFLRAEYDTLKDQVFDAQQTIEAAQNQRQWIEDAKEDIARLEEDKKEVARIQNELESTQTQLASLNEQKSGLDGEIAERKSRLEELDDKQRTLARDLQDLERELQRAAALREDLTQLEHRKKAAQEQAEQLEQAAAQLKRKLEDQLDQQKRAAKEEAERLEQAAAQARRKLEDELEQQKRTAKEEVDSLDRELNDLKRRREESEAAANKVQKSLDQLKSEKTDLEKERRKLATEVAELESKSNALNAQIPTLETMFDNLSSAVAQRDGPTKPEENEIWQPVLPVIAPSQQNSVSEQECLDDLDGSLRSLGLKFDRRTLYAFHTSLKTTDSSPLVTLAGVSGTGKSELPRRYAEATGMNFLNVAVQPRWDSPQDLFGFYDYLEKRFRPTDLTRALIQMDPIGPEEGRGWNPPDSYLDNCLPNQLLLVLLDEMNLARIEYYFSEFLSRLETRRGIDPSNAQKRKLAEISLDVGGRRSGEPPMQLFVDKNVLFVGTMNEDETTQALSDKVIDRANVLRFGSPNSIVPVPASERNGLEKGPRPRLTRETWNGWCKTASSLSSEDESTLLGWIGELRGSMDQVNRPFAYRVAHSMLEYAANYPRLHDAWLNHVIADQIEQKILPKLMGLNPQDTSVRNAFSTIDRILENVDDDVLKNRIDICRKDDYFLWTGIDRTEV